MARNTNDKMSKELKRGMKILIVGFVLGIVVAIFVVESSIPSGASNDGWLGFLGGMIGSFLSGIITVYVLYINRKDAEETAKTNYKNTEKIQKENFELAMKAQKTQIDILRYQVNRDL